jgi:hypothetical protein
MQVLENRVEMTTQSRRCSLICRRLHSKAFGSLSPSQNLPDSCLPTEHYTCFSNKNRVFRFCSLPFFHFRTIFLSHLFTRDLRESIACEKCGVRKAWLFSRKTWQGRLAGCVQTRAWSIIPRCVVKSITISPSIR